MRPETNTSKTWREILQQNQPRSIDELVEFLRIPSISTSEANVADILDAANWVAGRLKRAGMEHVEVPPTGPQACCWSSWAAYNR